MIYKEEDGITENIPFIMHRLAMEEIFISAKRSKVQRVLKSCPEKSSGHSVKMYAASE